MTGALCRIRSRHNIHVQLANRLNQKLGDVTGFGRTRRKVAGCTEPSAKDGQPITVSRGRFEGEPRHRQRKFRTVEVGIIRNSPQDKLRVRDRVILCQ